MGSLETVCYLTPTTVIVIAILLLLAALWTAIVNHMCELDDHHCENKVKAVIYLGRDLYESLEGFDINEGMALCLKLIALCLCNRAEAWILAGDRRK
ncbi:hypothetical protein EYC84_003843 [Monilinia fructicola]|uniref:Uncharacterized protein n=1 Tax=Monilinia fructicola TaxID=38448 RepID=A0A5M9JVZ5_MONFR|nr:hypothetical protein EYC84_003843 [Monilinia fructicola]